MQPMPPPFAVYYCVYAAPLLSVRFLRACGREGGVRVQRDAPHSSSSSSRWLRPTTTPSPSAESPPPPLAKAQRNAELHSQGGREGGLVGEEEEEEAVINDCGTPSSLLS